MKEEKITSIKFYYNGFRLNDDKRLVKCSYSLDNRVDITEPCVTIMVDNYGSVLPRELFEVHNDTDFYADYFDKDSATLTASHPLYKYVRAAALKAEISSCKSAAKYSEKSVPRARPGMKDFYLEEAQRHTKRAEQYTAELESLENIGQPTEADLKAVVTMNIAAENTKFEAQRAMEQSTLEKMIRKRSEQRKFIEKQMEVSLLRISPPRYLLDSVNILFFLLGAKQKDPSCFPLPQQMQFWVILILKLPEMMAITKPISRLNSIMNWFTKATMISAQRDVLSLNTFGVWVLSILLLNFPSKEKK